jgi:signal transduction histidine kinase
MVWHARRRQEALRVAESEASQRASTLARQRRFLNDVSHELRTPVTIARGHLELLMRHRSVPEAATALDELERVERLVERLLVLAKAEHPEFYARREVEVEPFLEDVFMRWSEVAPRTWRLGTLARGTVLVDDDALRHALDALLENAVKYTEPEQRIELSATATDGHVVIRVADDGSGIAPEARARVFDRFARADVARSRAEGGAGLGLAIVDAIARAHGGRCRIEPNGRRGSTFALELPGYRAAP